MSALMSGNTPLTNPLHGMHQALSWRPLLESPEQANAIFADAEASNADPYNALLNATVLPGLASAVTNAWQPREPEPMLAWMDAWRDALPMGLQLTILETLVFPKVYQREPLLIIKNLGPGGSSRCLMIYDSHCS